jgi:hypothetical protein
MFDNSVSARQSIGEGACVWSDGAMRLAGVTHVWPEDYHNFDTLVPDAAVSMASIKARRAWAENVFATPASKL